MLVVAMNDTGFGFCSDTGGGWRKFCATKKTPSPKKMTDDDRNASAAREAGQIVMIMKLFKS